MNDFTKEELETILDLFHYAEDSPCWRETKGWDDVLKVKLQSLIDNYCEHEFIATISNKDWNKRESYAIPICRKCNCSPRGTA